MAKYSIQRQWVSAAELGTDTPWIPEAKDEIQVEAKGFYYDNGFFFFNGATPHGLDRVFAVKASEVHWIKLLPE